MQQHLAFNTYDSIFLKVSTKKKKQLHSCSSAARTPSRDPARSSSDDCSDAVPPRHARAAPPPAVPSLGRRFLRNHGSALPAYASPFHPNTRPPTAGTALSRDGGTTCRLQGSAFASASSPGRVFVVSADTRNLLSS